MPKALLPSSMRSFLGLFVGLLSASTSAFADILVVDRDDPGAAFATIQAAVDAAASGDTVLIRAPRNPRTRYDGFVIDNKSLTVRGEPRPYLLTGTATVRNLAPDQIVVLRDLALNRRRFGPTRFASDDTSGPGLDVHMCAGSVRVQGCSMEGSVGARIWAGLQLTLARDVALVGCHIRGAQSPSLDEAGGSAIQAVASRLSAYDSTFIGGTGATEYIGGDAFGSTGGTGVLLAQRSVAWLAECRVEGGVGGEAMCPVYPCLDEPGDGGTGLDVLPGSVCFGSRSTLLGGEPGAFGNNSFGGGTSAAAGMPLVGSYASDDSTHVPMVVASSSLRGGDVARVTVEGTPGESVRLAVGRAGGFRFFGVSRGPLEVSDYVAPGGFVALGTIPANGVLVADVPLPTGSADASTTYWLQAAVDGPVSFRLSAPLAVTVDGSDVPSNFDRLVARVDPNAAADGDGTSWTSPFRSIGDAARALPWRSSFGRPEIWLREGSHTIEENLGILIGPGGRVLGGFAGSETSADQADPVDHPTLMEGDVLGNGSTSTANWSDNPETFFQLGAVEFDEPGHGAELRGLDLARASRKHNVNYSGAVIVYGDACVEACEFRRNYNTSIRHAFGRLRVDRCRFVQNDGWNATAVSSWEFGPADRFTPRSVEAVSCSFVGNRALSTGAIGMRYGESLSVVNCTFHRNESFASNSAGAIWLFDVAQVSITNSIFALNSRDDEPNDPTQQVELNNTDALVFAHNCSTDLSAAFTGDGNIQGDPSFVDPVGPNGNAGDEDDDLRLAPQSPCIDAGHNGFLSASDLYDLVGRARVRDDPDVVDTGVGIGRVVDLGAHER